MLEQVSSLILWKQCYLLLLLFVCICVFFPCLLYDSRILTTAFASAAIFRSCSTLHGHELMKNMSDKIHGHQSGRGKLYGKGRKGRKKKNIFWGEKKDFSISSKGEKGFRFVGSKKKMNKCTIFFFFCLIFLSLIVNFFS